MASCFYSGVQAVENTSATNFRLVLPFILMYDMTFTHKVVQAVKGNTCLNKKEASIQKNSYDSDEPETRTEKRVKERQSITVINTLAPACPLLSSSGSSRHNLIIYICLGCRFVNVREAEPISRHISPSSDSCPTVYNVIASSKTLLNLKHRSSATEEKSDALSKTHSY